MNWWSDNLRTCRRGAAALVGSLLLALSAGAQDAGMPSVVEGFRVPQFDDEGRLKTEVVGDSARVLADGTVEVTNLVLRVFKEGVLEAEVRAAHCVFDRQTQNVASDSDVTMDRSDLVIRGHGLRWYAELKRLEVLDNAEVVLKNKSLWVRKESGSHGK